MHALTGLQVRSLSKTANSLKFDGKQANWNGFRLALGAVLKQDCVEHAFRYPAPKLSSVGKAHASLTALNIMTLFMTALALLRESFLTMTLFNS